MQKIEEALKEAYRVLKPGGRFMCLEFSKGIINKKKCKMSHLIWYIRLTMQIYCLL